HDATGQLDRTVRDYLVRVHVRLRARAGLEHDQRELVIEATIDHILSSAHDEVDLVGWQLVQLAVRERGALLEDSEGADDGAIPAISFHADRKIAVRTFRLGAPEAIVGDLDLTQSVLFHARRAAVALVRVHDCPHASTEGANEG